MILFYSKDSRQHITRMTRIRFAKTQIKTDFISSILSFLLSVEIDKTFILNKPQDFAFSVDLLVIAFQRNKLFCRDGFQSILRNQNRQSLSSSWGDLLRLFAIARVSFLEMTNFLLINLCRASCVISPSSK
jgi:hypothetical protein